MPEVRVIEINESLNAANDKIAEEIRKQMKEQKTLFLNFMSNPGSGKTSLLSKIVLRLKDKLRIAVLDVDIKTSLDAQRVSDETGVTSIQINNGGLCHIDADMTNRALSSFDTKNFDLLILENIGNLVCPAEFDTGANKKLTILSIPEGDDKPLKYPLMYMVSDVVIFNKIDTLPYFNFDIEKAKNNVLFRNPNAQFFCTSAKTEEGLDSLCQWILEEYRKL